MNKTLVLVTGISGYLGSHVAKVFLDNGYKVRGTVRSLLNEEKVKPIRDLAKNAENSLELVEADLLDENSWEKAVQDCSIVAHVASPLPLKQPDNENELIKPAVQGTLNVLNACLNANVKRVVVTSSGLAITGDFHSNRQYSTKDWGDLETSTPYGKSKILAEKAAWNFVNERKNKNEPCFDLVVVNPTLILGPVLNDTVGTSVNRFLDIFKGRVDKVMNIYYPTCDVRDVALAHLKALTTEKAAGKRFVIVSESAFIPPIRWAQILNAEFGPKGYKIPLQVDVGFGKGQGSSFDDDETQEILELNLTKFENTVIDMANSLIERGFMDKN